MRHDALHGDGRQPLFVRRVDPPTPRPWLFTLFLLAVLIAGIALLLQAMRETDPPARPLPGPSPAPRVQFRTPHSEVIETPFLDEPKIFVL